MLYESTILLRLPKDLKEELDQTAKKYKVPRIGLIRFALVEWLHQKRATEFLMGEDRKAAKEEKAKQLAKLQKMQESLDQGTLNKKK